MHLRRRLLADTQVGSLVIIKGNKPSDGASGLVYRLVERLPIYFLGFNNAVDTLTTCGAVIYDNGGPNGDYSTYSNNILVLYPETPGSMMMLQGTCNVENSYDHLYIYDGVGTGGTQLGSFGNSNDQNVSVLSTTGPLTIHFTSDVSVQKWGFELYASCQTCFPPSG